MLTAIQIENYRGIRQGRVADLGPLNLFVGPNGSGKSTILEAIFLGAYGANPWFLLPEGGAPLIARRHHEPAFPSHDCWFRRDTQNLIAVRYEMGDQQAVFTIRAERGSIAAGWGTKGPETFTNYFGASKLLDVSLLLDPRVELACWDQLLNHRGDRRIIQVMNHVYGLDIESFSYSGDTKVLKVLFSNRDYALNVDDLGAGMRMAFRMLVPLVLSAGGATLLEEFDAYQHVESLPRLAEVMLKLASANATQLFLTSHSLEAVRAFIQASERTGVAMRVFQVLLSPMGDFEATALTPEEAMLLITGGVDVRKVP